MHYVMLAEHRLGRSTSARKQRWDDAPPFSLIRKRSKRFRLRLRDVAYEVGGTGDVVRVASKADGLNDIGAIGFRVRIFPEEPSLGAFRRAPRSPDLDATTIVRAGEVPEFAVARLMEGDRLNGRNTRNVL